MLWDKWKALIWVCLLTHGRNLSTGRVLILTTVNTSTAILYRVVLWLFCVLTINALEFWHSVHAYSLPPSAGKKNQVVVLQCFIYFYFTFYWFFSMVPIPLSLLWSDPALQYKNRHDVVYLISVLFLNVKSTYTYYTQMPFVNMNL